MPYTVNTLEEHLDMLMVCHHLSRQVPEDVAFAESRIRPETMAAEDVLHDLGAISIMASDSQAMGRVGEVISRSWQTAHKMKGERGPLPGDSQRNDNSRIKRYLAKYTLNPAIAHGIGRYVGSVEVGKLADLCLWHPAFFGVKPDLIIKGGFVVASLMGDANASIPTPEPVRYRPMFGALGSAHAGLCFHFVSKASLEQGSLPARLTRQARAVENTRDLSKHDMVHNDALPRVDVDPDSYQVTIDGEEVRSEAATELPLAQRYFLF